MKKYVFVFDICSSTVMIENLVQNEHIEDYSKLIDAFYAYLHVKKKSYAFEIHKFLGDGFILFFNTDTTFDDVLSFGIELTFFAKQILIWFKQTYLDLAKLPREGITIGIAYGTIYQMESINISSTEYVGRVINIASRLQSELNKPEHCNRILLQADLYQRIKGHLFKKACRETKRKLHNVIGNTPIRCYEFNPEIFIDFDYRLLQSPTNKTQKLFNDPDFRNHYEDQQKILEALIEEYINTTDRNSSGN